MVFRAQNGPARARSLLAGLRDFTLLALLSESALAGCECGRRHPAPAPGVSASALPVRTCSEVAERERFTIRSRWRAPAGELQEQGALLPFSVEAGRAALFPGGVALPYLSGDSAATHAGVALIPDQGPVKILDLAELRGTPSPPRVAASAGRLFVVLEEPDASGSAYRMATLSPNATSPEWGAEIDAGVDDSPAFDLAADESGAVLTWDSWDHAQNRGAVQVAVFGAGGEPRIERRSPSSSDAESPRIVARQGGYWLAWIANGQPLSQGRGGTDSVVQALDVTERWLEVVPLDGSGSSVAAPVRLRELDIPIQAFDLSSGHDGSLLIAWRGARAGAGSSGGRLGLSRVRVDGSVETRPVDEDSVGAGVPSLLFDPDPRDGAPHGWLAVDGADGRTRFSALSPLGEPLEALKPDRRVASGALLAAQHGQLVLGTASGRDLVLSRVRCLDLPPVGTLDGLHAIRTDAGPPDEPPSWNSPQKDTDR